MRNWLWTTLGLGGIAAIGVGMWSGAYMNISTNANLQMLYWGKIITLSSLGILIAYEIIYWLFLKKNKHKPREDKTVIDSKNVIQAETISGSKIYMSDSHFPSEAISALKEHTQALKDQQNYEQAKSYFPKPKTDLQRAKEFMKKNIEWYEKFTKTNPPFHSKEETKWLDNFYKGLRMFWDEKNGSLEYIKNVIQSYSNPSLRKLEEKYSLTLDYLIKTKDEMTSTIKYEHQDLKTVEDDFFKSSDESQVRYVTTPDGPLYKIQDGRAFYQSTWENANRDGFDSKDPRIKVMPLDELRKYL